jgi:hypothetical protein
VRKSFLVAAAVLFASGCGGVSFGRRVSIQEYARQEEIKAYYQEVKAAFAARNPEALASLFDAGISKPMTWPQILAWARRFFSENAGVAFHVDKLEFDALGVDRAEVALTYRVTTLGGKGDFGGKELDVVEKRAGHWRIVSWEKL